MPRDELGTYKTLSSPEVPVKKVGYTAEEIERKFREQTTLPEKQLQKITESLKAEINEAVVKKIDGVVGDKLFDNTDRAGAAYLNDIADGVDYESAKTKEREQEEDVISSAEAQAIEKSTPKAPEETEKEVKGMLNQTDIADVLEEGRKQAEQNRTVTIGEAGFAAIEEELNRASETVVAPEAAENPKPIATPEAAGIKKAVETFGEITPGDPNFYQSLEETTKEDTAPNHTIIGRLGARLERFGIKVASAPQKAALEMMYGWRSEHAARAEGKFEERKRDLAKAEEDLVAKDAEVERARTAGDKKFDAKYAIKMGEERAKLVNKRDKAKTRLKSAQVSLEHYNGQKAGWENKQKNLAEKIVVQIDQKLQPSREAFAELARQKGEVDKEIAAHTQAREMHEAYLTDLRARIAANPAVAEKMEIKTKIKTAVEMLNQVNNEYAQLAKEQGRIGAKMNRANLYIGQWDVMRNEQLRETAKDRRHFNPGEQVQEERGAYREPDLSHAPKASEPEVAAAQTNTETSVQTDTPEPANPGAAAPMEASQELKTDAGSYIKKWNELFKNEVKINPEAFADTYKIKLGDSIPTTDIENAIASMLTKGVTGANLLYMKSDIESRFKIVREEFKKAA
jgi:hypothetical protein